MKWVRRLGLIIGLGAGLLWLVFGVTISVGIRMFPLLLEGFIVGAAVIISSLVAWRWHIPGAVLLLLEGITPFFLLFIMARGYPLFASVAAGMTLVSGILFLVGVERFPNDRSSDARGSIPLKLS
ncbi:hypothetical protein E3J38_02670 [candidate division TA06 bacterium]|uniref:Integral membrane protein n=1 Tax=candidate division TA06 bacterium TaxID=2250710 RepID=A0A523XS82_UNCT6|nr:MAG: hypothetical protein E3J38_02670 [candidate division TA06 bacterium]